MKAIGPRIKKEKGIKMIAGDMNCIANPRIDKIGGQKNNGKQGYAEMKKWMKDMGLIDIWRERYPDRIGTTWQTRGQVNNKTVKTRIDKWIITEQLEDQGKIGEVGIYKTAISDHDSVTCQLLITSAHKAKSIEKVPSYIIQDKDYQEIVKQIYEDIKNEEGPILERHERFKEQCQKAGLELKKKKQKKKKRDK